MDESLTSRLVNLIKEKVSFFTAFLSIFSLLSAHYIGFLIAIPNSFITAVGIDFAPEVTGIFILYLTLALIVSKVVYAVGLYLIFAVATIPLFENDIRRITTNLISKYHKTISISALTIKVVLFYIVFLLFYYPEHFSVIDFLYLSFKLIMSLVLLILIYRLIHGKVNAENLLTFISLVVLVSVFFAGFYRFLALYEKTGTIYHDARISTDLSIIATDGTKILAVEHAGDEKRFLLLSKDYILAETVDDKDAMFHAISTASFK